MFTNNGAVAAVNCPIVEKRQPIILTGSRHVSIELSYLLAEQPWDLAGRLCN